MHGKLKLKLYKFYVTNSLSNINGYLIDEKFFAYT